MLMPIQGVGVEDIEKADETRLCGWPCSLVVLQTQIYSIYVPYFRMSHALQQSHLYI